MKLRPLDILVFPLSPATCGELPSPSPPNSVCKPSPLSAIAKKPASVAGFLYLKPSETSIARSLASRGPAVTHASFPQLDYSNSK